MPTSVPKLPGALWNRPAYMQGAQLATSNQLGGRVAWSIDANSFLRTAAWTEWRGETTDLDGRRSNHELTAGASVRWLKLRVSPELGVERSWRTATWSNLRYSQWRAFVQVSTNLGSRTWLSLLLRRGKRAYDVPDASLSNHGREDERRLARLSVAWRGSDVWRWTGMLAWEDGSSSGTDRSFSSPEGWVGVTWSPVPGRLAGKPDGN